MPDRGPSTSGAANPHPIEQRTHVRGELAGEIVQLLARHNLAQGDKHGRNRILGILPVKPGHAMLNAPDELSGGEALSLRPGVLQPGPQFDRKLGG